MTCDLFIVFHSAGPATLTVIPDAPQVSSRVCVVAVGVLVFCLCNWDINILRYNSLIHSVSFNANVKRSYWACYPLFAEKVRRALCA